MKNIFFFLFFSKLLFASYGELLFNGNCFTCHKIKTSLSAPSLFLIQKNYKNAFANKEDFVSYMSTWILEPKVETSLMQESITKYKLMPELAYQIDVINEISAYIYEVDFSKSK